MKWTSLFFLVITLHLGPSGLAQRVTISGKGLSLEEIFTEIRKQTAFEFLYESSLLKSTKPVNLDVNQMELEEVLRLCLQGQGLGFVIRNNTIIVFKDESLTRAERSDSLRKNAEPTAVYITGRVIDSRGTPIELASVQFTHSGRGTLTDRSGFFSLKVKSVQPSDSLYISFVGFKGQSIHIGSKRMLGQIVLQAADNMLDQSLVTAYGNTSERFRVGDVSKISAADIEKSPALNVAAALAGRVPGLYIRQNGGNPSSVYDITLRGYNVIPPSIGLSSADAINILSKPLIVVDGLPMAPEIVNQTGANLGMDAITGITGGNGGQDVLYWLNTLDVETISVLKDAEATTLYGSRAANGVIMITTKKSRPGRTSLNISFNTGVNAPVERIDMLNTQQYLGMRHEAWQNTIRAGLPVISGNLSYAPNASNSYDLLVWDTTRYTNWPKVLLGSAPTYNAFIELSGGEERTSYRLSAGYNEWKSSYPSVKNQDDFAEKKGTISLSVSSRSSNNRFKMTTSVISYVLSSIQPAFDPTPNIFLAPNAPPVFDATGGLNFPEWRAASPYPNFFASNPFFMLACPYTANRFGLQVRTDLTYELLKSLSFSLKAGYFRSENQQQMRAPSSAFDPLATTYTRSARFGNSTGIGLTVEPTLRYSISPGRHYLSLLGGASFQSDKQTGSIIDASGFVSDDLMNSPQNAQSTANYLVKVQRNSVSLLSRLSYRYANKYLAELSVRRDGSSSFSPEDRFGNFGSVGLGWIFTKEDWARHISWLSFGKVRASYGNSGSQSIDPYAYLSTFTVARQGGQYMPYFMLPNGNGIYQGVTAFSITRVANHKYSWAQATSMDLGIDLYFLPDQRIQFTFQWYQKTTSNQLVFQPVSTVTGTTTFLMNLPAKVRNGGVEALLSYSTRSKPSGFTWIIAANIAANRNELLAYPGLENSPMKGNFEIGKPLFTKQLYLDFLNTKRGVYTVIDSLHPLPISYRVNSYPDFTGGIQTTLSYKRIALTLSFTFAKQKGFINAQGANYPGVLSYGGFGNQPVAVVHAPHWQSPADSSLGGAFLATTLTSPVADIYWGNASYLALKNASLNYRFAESWVRKMCIQGLSLYVKAENLFFVTAPGFQGMNPEQPGLSSQLPLRMIVVGGFTINL
jgi:TonB-linked SusC/RagA family outer membrane protein